MVPFPVLSGATQEIAADELPEVALTLVGASGTVVVGFTAVAEQADWPPVPFALVAATLK